MATLTGTTIQSTYDSLLKVTDNDSITGSLKRITDGLGNNTPLYLSSSTVEIVSTLNVTSTITGSNLSGTNTGDETKASIETKLGAATSSNSGYLTSADWSTFSNKIAGSGTLNTIPKFSSSSSIGNSNITDTGSLITLGGGTYINGQLGIGTSSFGVTSLSLSLPLQNSATIYGVLNNGAVQSTATNAVNYFGTVSSTAAGSYTVPIIRHYIANGGTFGAGSTVSTQVGYDVNSTMIGATLNYGFRGRLASATGVWNLYMDGTANNYMAGSLGIGTTSIGSSRLIISGSVTGGTTSRGMYNIPTIQSDVTTAAVLFQTSPSTQATSFTLAGLTHYYAGQGTIGAGSAVTVQTGFFVDTNLIGAGTNYGFRGRIPAQTNAWNIYMDGTANNYMGGGLGIGATFLTAHNLRVDRNITGGSVSHGIYNGGIVQSDVTTQARYYTSAASTQATTFTCADLRHYLATQGTFGAGSTVSIQMGYMVDSTLIGATNNYGFRGQIPSGTGRWNIYMDGTASNYLNGTILIGSTFDIASNYKVQVTGDIYTSGSIAIGSVSSISTKLLGLGRSITGATTAYGITFEGNIESTVTTNGIVYRSYPIVTGGTLGAITHYIASKNAFIGGSTVTNQYGFFADASVSGATNNYGFYGNIASATGAWNLYMNGTAQNYINGNLGIGVAVPTVKLDVSGAGLFSSSVTASSFIKSGGTSAQLLAGDGSVVTAGTNITISGGTISSSAGLSGSGTTNYVAKFTGTSAIGNSLIFDNGTNVGIGTTSPATKFHVYGGNITIDNPSGTDSQIIFAKAGVSKYELYYENIGNSLFIYDRSSSAYRFFINSSGNVGIGTSSPATKLTIQGDLSIFDNSKIILGQNQGGGASLFYNSNGNLDITPRTGYNTIFTAGNVGIGTASPTGKLSIAGQDEALRLQSNGVFISFLNASNTTRTGYIQGNAGSNITIAAEGSNFLQFTSATDILSITSGNERMRINAGGSVGIGTSAPAGLLDLNSSSVNDRLVLSYSGSPKCVFGVTSAGVSYLYHHTSATFPMWISAAGNFGIGTTSPYAKLMLSVAASASDVHALEITNNTDASFAVYLRNNITTLSAGGAGNMVFSNSSERMRITSTGNVGIGTTSPAYKLDVVGGINYQNQFNRQTASYTLVLTDASKIVETNVGSANNLTVPLNSSVAFPIGTEIAVLQYGSGQTTIVATGGVTLRSKSNALKISGQFAGCTLVKVGTDEWYVVGDLTI